VNAILLPRARAAAELKQGRPDRAIDLLRPVARFDRVRTDVIFLRGLSYLNARQGAEAAAEFQKILDHRASHWGPFYPVAYVGLARGAALAGDHAKARKAYQDLFSLWKDADPDIPILIEARKEYAALK
jgi:hypothetical protein